MLPLTEILRKENNMNVYWKKKLKCEKNVKGFMKKAKKESGDM